MLSMRGQGVGFVAALLLMLSACSGGGSGSSGASEGASGSSGTGGSPPVSSPGTGTPLVVSGSVGDGPVVGATLEFVAADGREQQSESTETADYRQELSADGLPVLIVATGGTDLVTGRPLDFPLLAAVLSASSTTVNVSPLTTLAVRAAQCSAAGLTATGLQAAWGRIYADLSLGLDDGLVDDPMADKVTVDNVATVVLANEALGESVRRTMVALSGSGQPVSGEEIVRQVACDLMGERRSGAVNPRIVATFKAAELGVRLETLAGRLEVDGYSATVRMDDAIRTIRPAAAVDSVASLRIPQSARLQAQRAAGLWMDLLADERFVRIALMLDGQALEALRSAIDGELDTGLKALLQELPAQVARSEPAEIDAIGARRSAQPKQSRPAISFAASRQRVVKGDPVTLTWASSGADLCLAEGDWGGLVGEVGSFRTAGLQQSASFRLTCAGMGGFTAATVGVLVDDLAPAEPAPTPEPAPAPEPAPHPAAPHPAAVHPAAVPLDIPPAVATVHQ